MKLPNGKLRDFLFLTLFVVIFNITARLVGPSNAPDFIKFLFLTVLPLIVSAIFFGHIVLKMEILSLLRFMSGFLLFMLALDLISVPPLIDNNGIVQQILYGGGTTDAQVVVIWHGLGIYGWFLSLAMYILAPIFMIGIALLILKYREFKNIA